jgi:hypothetical protein
VRVCVDCTYVLVNMVKGGRVPRHSATLLHLCPSLPLFVQYCIPYPISLQHGIHLDGHQSFIRHLSHVMSNLDLKSFLLLSSTSTGYLFGGDEPITNESNLEFLRDWLLQLMSNNIMVDLQER